MTDYTKTSNFTAKDARATGHADKLVKGSDHDTEYDNIATAVATKYDSGTLASQAQAEAGTSNVTLMTPLRTEQWSATWAAENGGMVGDIQALADPAADTLLGWDDSASAAIGFTLGAGLSFGDGVVDLASGVAGAGITMTSQILSITDVAATTTNPVDISSSAVSLDVEALTTIEGNALAPTDTFYVEDGGVSKGIEVQALGFRVQTSQSTQNLVAADMNTVMEFNGTATVTIQPQSSTTLPTGVPILLVVDHATQVVTVTAGTGVTLNSIYHPGGALAASDVIIAGGGAVLIQTEADQWYLTGDIADS